ncbi:MAG: cofactor-independent phosphoglycerate mutase [Promethearchaeia archaeon]
MTKYIILICDGAADWPLEELGNKTIFEAAKTPALDWIASHGKMGTLQTIPNRMAAGSECANMTIMGYLPEKDLTGRGPLEALSARVPLKENDLAFRCNIITIKKGIIDDHSSGHISSEESEPIIESLQNQLHEEGVDFFHGVQYRHILRLDGTRFSANVKLTPPHDQLGKPYRQFLPKPLNPNNEKAQKTASYLRELIERSHTVLMNHEINKNRKAENKKMATHIWPWSGGKKPEIEPFEQKYGLKGSVISAVDLIFGLGIAAGMDPIHVEGATGLPNTNYKGKVSAALQELKKKDFIYLHIEATDEMGHTGTPQKKIAAIEDFDELIVKPFIEAEKTFNNQLVIAVLPDHPTPCKIRTHSREPVPFAIYNPRHNGKSFNERKYSEKAGKKGEYGLITNGEAFMRLFLGIEKK